MRKTRTGLSFEQLKEQASKKNLRLERHPKGGFQVFFQGSEATIHAETRLYRLEAVRNAIEEHIPLKT